jgi:site-specific DNA recombinase
MSLQNYGSEMEREKARQRTYDAMTRKAKAGHVASGKVYGYDNVEVLSPIAGPDGRRKRLHVIRRINAEQATIVRRIFEMCASGMGLTRMAKALNAEHVPPPRGDGKGWAPTAIREMLHRPLYRGEIVWNKSQKISRGGTKKQRKRPAEEWIRLEAPELLIVSDDLWTAAHERLAQARDAFARATKNGQLLGHPSRLDLDSPYLLSGMARCAECGGAIIAMTRGHGKKRGHFYGRSYNYKRGATVCPNDVQIPKRSLTRLCWTPSRAPSTSVSSRRPWTRVCIGCAAGRSKSGIGERLSSGSSLSSRGVSGTSSKRSSRASRWSRSWSR